jgi:hypothetical protein
LSRPSDTTTIAITIIIDSASSNLVIGSPLRAMTGGAVFRAACAEKFTDATPTVCPASGSMMDGFTA